MGKESPDNVHDIRDVTSRNVLILVQYMAQNLGDVAICNFLFMQLVFNR